MMGLGLRSGRGRRFSNRSSATATVRSRRGLHRVGLMPVLCALGLAACSGSVETIPGEPDETGGAASGGGGGTGGTFPGVTGGTGGDGTGGVTYVEPECPDEEPPPVVSECDPLSPEDDCGTGFGCYPYLEYPFGERCGHATFGTVCALAGEGQQGQLCGEETGDYCAPGFMCVVGATGGKRCGKICEPIKDHGCPDGLICGETDIQGYGVCF